MPGSQIAQSRKPFLRIVGGNIVQEVPEGTEGAKLREYETPSGKTGKKWELNFINWTGKVE